MNRSAAVGAAMAGRPHVAEVHDLHVWEITSGMPAGEEHCEDAHGPRHRPGEPR